MKMRKIAKDRAGTVLKEGDIIRFNDGIAVVEKIDQPRREEFPTLVATKATTDWKGKLEKYGPTRLQIDDYKQCLVVERDKLRDDVQHLRNLKLMSVLICDRLAYRHKVTG